MTTFNSQQNLILSKTTIYLKTSKSFPHFPPHKKPWQPFLFTPSPSFVLTRHKLPTELSSFKLNYKAGRSLKTVVRSYKVVIEHEGQSTELEVEPDETILSKALDSGLTVPHDCKLGVCMTCPAKLISGSVDQSDGMLSDDVVERGYALLCAAYPKSDCQIRVIPEEELLSLQLATAND
ncbi:FERREDOXIN C 1 CHLOROPLASTIC [Salix viminalis]|uniref:Ferredoxin n=1 Tax=Salix viminalis TaxID=40686 RepID=A0A9Q0Z4Z3_SALVM|nr:FERREDOXIN C 1 CHLOROPLASTIC [Salix viminalis]